MNPPITLTNTWQQAVTGASVFVVQTNVEAEIYIGTSPSTSDRGFLVPSDVPHALPEVAALGGEIWVRGSGELIYASDV